MVLRVATRPGGPWRRFFTMADRDDAVSRRRDPTTHHRATPRWLSGTERGVFRVAQAQGAVGAAARRVSCRAT